MKRLSNVGWLLALQLDNRDKCFKYAFIRGMWVKGCNETVQ